MSRGAPDISVVVPTRDRPESLALCLAALERQSAESLEVVVVDDGSSRAEAVAAVVADAGRARLVRGSGAGPAAARNAGARAALAPVVCFTDDDCEPTLEWAARLATAVADGADAAVGATVNARPDDPLATASQTITNYLTEAALERASGRVGFGPSCNVACRAEVIAAVPFDERYPLAAGEDRDWCARLGEFGRVLVYEPSAVVAHRQDLSLSAFWRQQVRYGRGAYRFRRTRQAHRGLERPRFYTGLVRRGFEQGFAAGALMCLAQAATALGMTREALAEVRAGGR